MPIWSNTVCPSSGGKHKIKKTESEWTYEEGSLHVSHKFINRCSACDNIRRFKATIYEFSSSEEAAEFYRKKINKEEEGQSSSFYFFIFLIVGCVAAALLMLK